MTRWIQPLRQSLMIVAAFFVLNALLSMTNWWPTPFVKLDARIAPEFVLLWAVILLVSGWRVWRTKHVSSSPAPWFLWTLTGIYFVLVIGRYFDTTAPALFARDLNLYWDIQQIPRVMYATLRSYPLWVSLLIMVSLAALFAALWYSLRWAIRVLVLQAAPKLVTSLWTWVITACALAASIANFNGVQATWPYMSKPASPTYVHQAKLLWSTLNESALQKNLPPSPAFDSDLALLRGSDVMVVFAESYGQIAYGIPEINDGLRDSRQALASQVKASGMQAVSAFVGSTTYGGRSELAHVAFLAGVDTTSPWVHDLLISTERPILTDLFTKQGFEVHGLYPALSWDWPEAKFYRFNRFMDSREMNWRGPKLGYWSLPDQYTVARYLEKFPITAQSPPRFLFFPTITSHLPFHPVPPYLENWADILRESPFNAAQLADIAAQKEQWFNMRPAYTAMLRYNYDLLRGWIAQPRQRDMTFIVMGDHQPAANVTGEGASWDVPVHIISTKPQLLERLKEKGFVSGLEPKPQAVGKLFDLTRILMDAADSQGKTSSKHELKASQ